MTSLDVRFIPDQTENDYRDVFDSAGLLGIVSKIEGRFALYERHASESKKRQIEGDIRRVRPQIFCPDYVAYFVSPAVILSTSDIEDLRNKARDVISLGVPGDIQSLGYLLHVTHQKMINLQNAAFHDLVNVLSLGGDCLPRNVLAKWGVKLPRVFGENSMPFDLAVHPFRSTIEILRNDFADYLDIKSINFSKASNFPVHTKYHIDWNHELGSDWADDEFSKFKQIYTRRIETFRHSLNDGKCSLLVMHMPGTFGELQLADLAEATKAVAARSKNKITVLCFLTGEASLPASVGGVECGSAYLHLASVLMPKPPYSWHSPKWYSKKDGLLFEKKLIEATHQVAETLVGKFAPFHI